MSYPKILILMPPLALFLFVCLFVICFFCFVSFSFCGGRGLLLLFCVVLLHVSYIDRPMQCDLLYYRINLNIKHAVEMMQLMHGITQE